MRRCQCVRPLVLVIGSSAGNLQSDGHSNQDCCGVSNKMEKQKSPNVSPYCPLGHQFSRWPDNAIEIEVSPQVVEVLNYLDNIFSEISEALHTSLT